MSELAFNLNGERFELPAAAAFWRVRRLKDVPRGGPEVVFGRDGVPLVIPVDTDIEGFRQYVDYVPGRYRLDPVDERHKPLEGVPAAYIQVAKGPGPRNCGGSVAELAAPLDERDAVIKEVVRANAEMVKVIAEKFAAVMQSAADLLRAADGAGLPSRKPPEPEPRNGIDDEENDEDDGGPPSFLEVLAPFVPLIQQAMASHWSGRATPPPPVVVRNSPGAEEGSGEGEAAADSADEEKPSGGNGQGNGHGMQKLTAAQLAHVSAVYGKLTPHERAQAQQAAMLMPAQEREVWLAELCSLPVDEAVELIRGAIAQSLGTEGKGGAS